MYSKLRFPAAAFKNVPGTLSKLMTDVMSGYLRTSKPYKPGLSGLRVKHQVIKLNVTCVRLSRVLGTTMLRGSISLILTVFIFFVLHKVT